MINPLTGEYTYHLNNSLDAVQGLSPDNPGYELFHIAVRDEKGAFDIKDVTITVHGAEDYPLIDAGVHVHKRDRGRADPRRQHAQCGRAFGERRGFGP